MSTPSPLPEIVVTGMGAVTPYGPQLSDLETALLSAHSAITPLPENHHLTPYTSCHATASFGDWIKPLIAESPTPADALSATAWHAASQALKQAHLNTSSKKIGLIHALGWNFPHPDSEEFTTPPPARLQLNHCETQLKKHLPISEPIRSCLSACAASTQAIAQAARILQSNPHIDAILTGSADSRLNPLGLLGYTKLNALAHTPPLPPATASRPFDKSRNGFVPGEATAFLLLERKKDALSRQTPILARITAWASTSDAHRITDPEPSATSASHCINSCLQRTNLTPDDISWIAAHGTSTPQNDTAEARAITSIFHSRKSPIPLTAMKSLFGHTAMASGVLETIATILCLKNQFIPPILNLENPEPFPSIHFLTQKQHHAPSTHVLKNSFGFGGQNTSLIISAP